MENAIRDISKILPNFPEEVARLWLAPFVQYIGLPNDKGRWIYILAGRPLQFWRTVQWNLETVNLSVDGVITSDSRLALHQMYKAYFESVQNDYTSIDDGKQRTLRVLKFIKQHRKFPCPPVGIRSGDKNPIEIVDGNHRMLAYGIAMQAFPSEFDTEQSVWIGSYTP